MTENQEFGRRGEALALAFYQENGYAIVEQNWRNQQLEVDLIVKNEEYLVFCEVKARSGNVLLEPQAAVTPQKQRNLIRAANYYVLKHRITLEVRFDIVAITLNGDRHTLEHIPFAFGPKW